MAFLQPSGIKAVPIAWGRDGRNCKVVQPRRGGTGRPPLFPPAATKLSRGNGMDEHPAPL
jgi:hypothetical protein